MRLNNSSFLRDLLYFQISKLLRRFERRILVDLPDHEDRMNIIQHYLPEFGGWMPDIRDELAAITDNFTGAEIKIACKEASLDRVRQIIAENTAKHSSNAVRVGQLKRALQNVTPSMLSTVERHREWSRNVGHKMHCK